MNLLQQFIFPNENFSCPQNLFIRSEKRFPLNKNHLALKKGETFSTDTYYNAFSIGKWRQYTIIKNFNLHINLQGHCSFAIYLQQNQTTKLISTQRVNQQAVIPISTPATLNENCLIFMVCDAIEYSEIKSIDYMTETTAREIQLAIIITHFNRQTQLAKTVERLHQELLATTDHIELIVVDNSRNATLPIDNKIHHIKNPNYGGSGGFARGLIAAEHINSSHCLLMDDDASCEIESIKRTIQLLRFNRYANPAIVGALHQTLAPDTLIEKGATFRILCKPYLDKHKVNSLQQVQQAETPGPINYGGWWFFACKLPIQHYPFPFFVRGDDVLFSIMNQFNLQTMNGINAFGDDFEAKNGPIAQYLDLRNHLIQIMTVTTGKRTDCLYLLLRFYLKNLLAFQYERIKAMELAIVDVLAGPAFFEQNLDLATRLPLLKQWQEQEKKTKTKSYIKATNSIAKKIISLCTLGGHLLPNCLLKKQAVYKDNQTPIAAYFGYQKISCNFNQSEMCFETKIDRKAFITSSYYLLKKIVLFIYNFSKIKNCYLDSLKKMTSKHLWMKKI